MSVPEPRALPSVSPSRVDALLERFAGLRIAVVGDVMLDHFVYGRVSRISPEAPVPVVEFEREEFRLGGAANVARNVAALGAVPALTGLIGADDMAAHLREALAAEHVDAAGLVVDPSRPTTRKLRIVTSRHQQVARVDYEHDGEVAGDVERALRDAVAAATNGARAIVLSDYMKGAVSRTIAAAAIAAGGERLPVLVDPKIPHLEYYSGATVITPNNAEAETAAHARIRTHADARSAARVIRDRAVCRNVLITRGDAGMWLLGERVEGYLPALTRDVADVTGAGDTVIATLALAMAAGADIAEAAALANVAAAISVTKFGPAAVTPAELLGNWGPGPNF